MKKRSNMLKNFINIGVSYKDLDVNLLELFFFNDVKKILDEITSIDNIEGCVLLQTCNRVEIFASCKDVRVHHELLKIFINNFLSNISKKNISIDINEVIGRVFVLTNANAIKRLFRIASGLESMAIGEYEILYQIKDSYEFSKREGYVDEFLSIIFEKAIKVGNKIRKKIDFKSSIVDLSIEYLRRKGVELKNKKILLIGAGKFARQILKKLYNSNEIIITNRTYERAKHLAERFGAKVIKFEELKSKILYVDIIISAIYSDKYVINAADIPENSNLIILDLSFPRTIDPEVSKRAMLITINDLREIHFELLNELKSKLYEAEKIIDEEVNILLKKFHEVYVNDIIKNLYINAEKRRIKELNELYSYMRNLSKEEKLLIENFSKALVKSILNPIVENLKSHAQLLDKKSIEILRRIFSYND